MNYNYSIIFLIATLAMMMSFSVSAYTVECEGFDPDTGASVTGQCKDGRFKGRDSETGANVLGTCEHSGGPISAANIDTGEHISGSCGS